MLPLIPLPTLLTLVVLPGMRQAMSLPPFCFKAKGVLNPVIAEALTLERYVHLR